MTYTAFLCVFLFVSIYKLMQVQLPRLDKSLTVYFQKKKSLPVVSKHFFIIRWILIAFLSFMYMYL